MATVKISDLHLSLSASVGSEEFIEAISSSVTRALDARQLQDIRGGYYSATVPIATLGFVYQPELPTVESA